MSKSAREKEYMGARMYRYEKIRQFIKYRKCRSAWDKGVNEYAFELLDKLVESIEDGYFDFEDIDNESLVAKQLLNGATSWSEYSWGGCSLIFDYDIAERLCTPSELKKTKNGQRRPNSREEWLDTQARALTQASMRVQYAIKYTK